MTFLNDRSLKSRILLLATSCLCVVCVSRIVDLPFDSTSLPSSTFVPNSNVAFAAKSTIHKNASDGLNFLEPISMEYDGVELSSFLERYAELFGFDFFIDRRVDPSTKLSGSFTNEIFVSALEQMLKKVELSFCIVDDSFLYVGPQDAAGEALLLFTLKREEILTTAHKQAIDRLNSYIDFEIEELSEPDEVFQNLSKRARLKFAGFEKTPFDRWRASEFSNVTVTDLITILGLGFNVDYKYDPDTGAIKPIALNRSQKVTRFYPLDLERQVDSKKFPNCSFNKTKWENEPVVEVQGKFEDVAKVEYEYSAFIRQETIREAGSASRKKATSRAPQKSKNKREDDRTFHVEISGRIQNKPLGDLFTYLQKNSQITCVLDQSLIQSGITTETRITCEFNKSDISQVASIIAQKIGATTKIDGTTIVFSKE